MACVQDAALSYFVCFRGVDPAALHIVVKALVQKGIEHALGGEVFERVLGCDTSRLAFFPNIGTLEKFGDGHVVFTMDESA